jgi:hypothetical protein
MWLTFGKIALVGFLVLAVVFFVVVYVRNSRRKGFPTPESSSHHWQIEGAMPPMPKPEWADQMDDDDPEEFERRRQN